VWQKRGKWPQNPHLYLFAEFGVWGLSILIARGRDHRLSLSTVSTVCSIIRQLIPVQFKRTEDPSKRKTEIERG
jgi:hypothetical protein